MFRIPEGSINRSTELRLENAFVSTSTVGLSARLSNRMPAEPANAYASMRRILLWHSEICDTFWRPAKANDATTASGVCWIERSRSRGSPRNANGLMVVMLFRSRDSFRRAFRPRKASLLITGKMFFCRARVSTVRGMFLRGISRSSPLLHITWGRRRNTICVLAI